MVEAAVWFEATGDDHAAARAWLAAAHHAGLIGDEGELEAVERALDLGVRASALPEQADALRTLTSTVLFGSTPAPEGIERCRRILDTQGLPQAGRAGSLRALAGLSAMQGRFDEARGALEEARTIFERLHAISWITMGIPETAGFIEWMAGDWAAAERIFRRSDQDLAQWGDVMFRPSMSANLARALAALGRAEEAADLADEVAAVAAPDDVDAQLQWRLAKGHALRRLQRPDEAEDLAREAVARAGRSLYTLEQGEAHLLLGKVLLEAGRPGEAALALETAIERFRAKGVSVRERRAAEVLALVTHPGGR
jgi:tetratricopeptide (TPR) repeat protein